MLILAVATSGLAQRSRSVRGSVTKTGQVRQPHVRTAPDRTQTNNYLTKGNVNPHTGKAGTKTSKK